MTRPAPASPEAARLRSGFLLCDKPAGITSHDVVYRVRRELGGKQAPRVGHAGTLDPFATGLLIVLVGAGTRLQRYVLGLPKTYVATARLGWVSSTGDPDGVLRETGRIPADLGLPTGRMTQTVPMTSAVRVDGERLYRKAHRGEEVERPSREVTIERAEMLEDDSLDEGRATFEIECSSGTYVRTLIETLEDAYCESLRRAAIGPFRLDDAGPEIRPVEDLLPFLAEIDLEAGEAQLIRNGVRIEAAGRAPEGSEPARLTCGGRLIAVARAGEDGLLRTDVVLPVIE